MVRRDDETTRGDVTHCYGDAGEQSHNDEVWQTKDTNERDGSWIV